MPFDDSTIDIPRSEVAVPQPERRVSLVVYHRDGVRVIPLADGAPLELGRMAPADVIIAEATLSRRHARFLRNGEEVCLEDLGSTNGTWVNGERIQHTAIKVSDEIALGSVSVSLHIVAPAPAQLHGLDGYDRFQTLLEHEVDRARTFGRKLSLIMVREVSGSAPLLERWCPRVRRLLRSVDRIGLYGPGTAELLLPETDLDQALRVARAIVGEGGPGEPTLLCGVAVFPDHATSTEALVEVCRAALRCATQAQPVQAAASQQQRQQTGPPARPTGPVIHSAAMRELYQTVDRLAVSMIPVLVVGETGVGKEVVARSIHERGPRRKRPLLSINCGAIPEQLIESALFGHQRGAFTGADRAAEGVFASADGGTVFLDEIGELSQPAQVALLRVLETKRVVPVGATREVAVDVRIIAATHQDLEGMCEQGAFRWDLLYRLTTMVLQVPPLRERPTEIAPLAERFLGQALLSNELGRAPERIDPTALRALEHYDWPGNIRQLRNVIDRAVTIADGPLISLADLPERVRLALPDRETGQAEERERRTATVSMPITNGQVEAALAGEERSPADDLFVAPGAPNDLATGLKQCVDDFECSLIRGALRRTEGNQTGAARLLRIPRRTLLHKMKLHGIEARSWAEDPAPGAFAGLPTTDPDGVPLTFKEQVDRFEAELVSDALVRAGGDLAQAARLLQIPQHAVAYRARKYGIR